jgi:hypothetical protein
MIQILPNSHMLKKTRIAMIQYIVYWLNILSKLDQDFSPRDLIFGEEEKDYKSICQLPYGAYV